jgi:hypothetical protein
MRNLFMAVMLLAALPLSAKDKPAPQTATFLGTSNVDCLTVRESTATFIYSLGSSYHGLPVPIPIGTLFPDKKTFEAIKVYQIRVGLLNFDAIPDRKNPLVMVAPGDAITVTLTNKALYVMIVKDGKTKKFKFLVIRTNRVEEVNDVPHD